MFSSPEMSRLASNLSLLEVDSVAASTKRRDSKITKQDFVAGGRKLSRDERNSDDPLSSLDPFWTMNK